MDVVILVVICLKKLIGSLNNCFVFKLYKKNFLMCLKNLNVLLLSVVSVKGCFVKLGLMVIYIYKKLVKDESWIRFIKG